MLTLWKQWNERKIMHVWMKWRSASWRQSANKSRSRTDAMQKKVQAVSPFAHPASSCCHLVKSPASSFSPVCNHYYHCQHYQHYYYSSSPLCNQEHLLVTVLVVVVDYYWWSWWLVTMMVVAVMIMVLITRVTWWWLWWSPAHRMVGVGVHQVWVAIRSVRTILSS